ncbi:TPA: acylneuraminate cytidylyltransferase family protein, partial [Escherichia coli]|nr:acylneuraminate cytidylyltransferase family protein [Escherichia coli]
MSILAIIPARANSKRLPNKNILKLAGKPLIKWTIDSALQCNDISKVMVSTDSPKIAELATQFGADVPYLRCAELSGDTASSYDVVIDAISYYRKTGKEFKDILLLQPTSPLRDVKDINNAISLYRKRDANAVVSVVECEHSPLWCNTLPDSLRMDNFINDEIKKTRSQDLPKYYQINGAIYLIKTESLLREKTFIPKKTFALIMSKKNSV